MNREEVLEIFPEADEAQLIALAAIMDRSAGEVFQLREEGARLKEKIAQYEAAEEMKQAETQRAKLAQRFEAAVGDREFVHEFVRESVLEDFLTMLADEANAGRSDREIVEELTQDKGCFVKRYQVTMGTVGEVSQRDVNRLSDAEYYEAFRLKSDR